MRFKSKSMMTGLVLVLGAGALLGCGGGGGGSALKMLPGDTGVVMGFDLGKAKGTSVWAAGEDLYKTFSKDDAMKGAVEDMQDKLKKFTKKTGLDPVEDLASITMGMDAIAGLGAGPQMAFILTAKKEFDEDGIVEYVEDEMKVELDKEEVKEMNVYSMGKEGSFAFFDKKTLVGGTPDFVAEMVELKGGKGKSAAENKELAAAVKKVESGAAAWVAAAVTEDMAKGMKSAPVKGLDDAVDVAASLVLGKGFKIVVKIGFEKKEDAADVVDELEKSAKDGKKMAKEMGKDMPFLKDVVESYKIEAKGNDAVITVEITEETLDAVVKWAKKDGKGLLPMLLGGGMGSMPMPTGEDGTGGGGGGGSGDGAKGSGGSSAKLGGSGPDGSDSLADIVGNVKGAKMHDGLESKDTFHAKITEILADRDGGDVLLVVDATGTMVGIVNALSELERPFKTFTSKGGRIAVASFKDEGDEYVSRLDQDFTDDPDKVVDALRKVKDSAGGGGDLPEGIYEGLAEAGKASWKGGDKLVILVSDADGGHARKPARDKTYGWFSDSGAELALLKPSFF